MTGAARRLEVRKNETQTQLDIINEKIMCLKKDKKYEIDRKVLFKLEHDIAEAEEDRKNLETKMEALEAKAKELEGESKNE